MKNIEYDEFLLDCDAVLLHVWKMFHYSPKQELHWNLFKTFMVKKSLKMLKAAVTQWLTQEIELLIEF